MMSLLDGRFPVPPYRPKEPEPLAPAELVSDATLRVLAKGEPDWRVGELSPQMQSMVAMALPDICGELLAYRAAARVDPPLANRHRTTSIGE